jgi:hypothetical protein
MLARNRLLLFFFCSIFTSCISQKETPKELKVKEIIADKNVTLLQVSKLLEEHTELQYIDVINWDAFSYRPKVSFRIAHANNQIWLKYYVNEKSILAEVSAINGGVANDSCVEFFFDPQGDGNYYNFEFSCIGVTHLAYGPKRKERVFIAPEIIEKEIEVNSSLGNQPFAEKSGDFTWEMTIIIPGSILTQNRDIQLKGLSTKANFYKCGNKTAESHYLSWNPIVTERPDFHLAEYFGTLVFE